MGHEYKLLHITKLAESDRLQTLLIAKPTGKISGSTQNYERLATVTHNLSYHSERQKYLKCKLVQIALLDHNSVPTKHTQTIHSCYFVVLS